MPTSVSLLFITFLLIARTAFCITRDVSRQQKTSSCPNVPSNSVEETFAVVSYYFPFSRISLHRWVEWVNMFYESVRRNVAPSTKTVLLTTNENVTTINDFMKEKVSVYGVMPFPQASGGMQQDFTGVGWKRVPKMHTYMRFLNGSTPESASNVVFLDTDMMVVNDISSIFSTPQSWDIAVTVMHKNIPSHHVNIGFVSVTKAARQKAVWFFKEAGDRHLRWESLVKGVHDQIAVFSIIIDYETGQGGPDPRRWLPDPGTERVSYARTGKRYLTPGTCVRLSTPVGTIRVLTLDYDWNLNFPKRARLFTKSTKILHFIGAQKKAMQTFAQTYSNITNKYDVCKIANCFVRRQVIARKRFSRPKRFFF
eukprot:1179170-Prorocentrum_minimum.AAC.2